MSTTKGYECPKCKNNYSTAYSMYRHMRKVHNCDINRCVTLYCPIENCNQSYDRYNALDTHLTHVHYADIRKETLNFSTLSDFETWLKDITEGTKTKFIKRSCNNSYRYYRCHRSGLPKTSTEKINTMKSSVKIGRHCPSRIIAKITDGNVQVEFVPTHIGHDCEIAKLPLSQKKRLDIACRLATSASSNSAASSAALVAANESQNHQQSQQLLHNQQHQSANSAVSTSPQATTSTIIQAPNNTLMVAVSNLKPQQQQPQIGSAIQQSRTHIIQATLPQQSTIQNSTSNLMSLITPTRQELNARFDQLLSAIRSDKHASIVKAQLEVCFALIRE